MSLLAGLTVLDVGFMVAGPGATRILGDLGADVVKVEPPTGDVGRRLLMKGDVSVLFENYNRNKRSISIDLTSPSGQEVLSDLMAHCDAIITNFRPEFLQRVGLTWEAVHGRNRRAVLAVISTFGLDDDQAWAPGGDVVAQAEAGLASFNGEPGGTPLLAQNAPADVAGALYAALATLAACFDARRSGIGRMIDVSLTHAYATLDVGITPYVLATDGEFQPQAAGRFHPNFTPHGVFRAPDRHIVISAYGSGQNAMWPRLAAAIGVPDLADADGYQTDLARAEHREEITDLIESWLSRFQSADDAVQSLREAGVIAAVIRTPNEVISSDRARRGGFVRHVQHPTRPDLGVLALPMDITGFTCRIEPAPTVGQHTVDILRNLLNYDQHRIDQLLRSAAVMTEGTAS